MNGSFKVNVLGIDLNVSQVDALLANESNAFDWQRNWLTSFFQLDNSSELIKSVLIRYAEADTVMMKISVGTNEENIYARLIGTIVSAKRCYSNAEYLACIELCALHGEMLANYLCITDKDKLDQIVSELLKKDRKLISNNKTSGIYFSDGIGQPLRLRWLAKADVITVDDREKLMKVHKLRTKYFHHWSPKSSNEQGDAIMTLTIVSQVTAKYLEILGNEPRTYNNPNLERVKRYMQIVSAIPAS